jgi:hypothetical protein
MSYFDRFHLSEVIPQKDYTLILKYRSGEVRTYDCSWIFLNGGPVTKPLKDKDYFMKAEIGEIGDSVYWPNSFEIGPEALYQKSVNEQ